MAIAASVTSDQTEALLDQVRRSGIADQRVLQVLQSVPRNLFVPATFAEHAWDDTALPIGHGQTISRPSVVAAMTAALEVGPLDTVLEIGTGSGYQAAILARLARRVFTIERHRALWRQAEARFATLRLRNVITRFGDGTKGWPESAPFDRVIFTAAAPELPSILIEQLAPGGILIGPVGRERREQVLVRIRRSDAGAISREELGLVRFVPLVAGLPRNGSAAAASE